MYEINELFNNIPRKLLEELKNNGLPINKMDNTTVISGLIYLSSIICNKQLTGSVNLNIPEIPKEKMHDLIKEFLNYIDPNLIDDLLEQYTLSSELNYDPINTIAFYDTEQTIRVAYLLDDFLENIWNSLPPLAQENQKMIRYFKYKLDNPPLVTLMKLLKEKTDFIDFLKGHGSSPIVTIPKKIDYNLSYILGAIRDGGIHYDRKNNAYKIHFEQKEFFRRKNSTKIGILI